MKKRIKRMVIGVLSLGLLSFLSLILCDKWVNQRTESYLFEDVSQIPEGEVALVLGTIKYARSGNENLFFTYRIEAAPKLYHSGKIKHFILSGDNHREGYDEPTDMKEALMARGIPESAITLDYAGFRTLDSIVRSKEVFGQKKLTIISQKFHNQRAIFIAQQKGIEAIGWNAKGVSQRYSPKTYLREYFARVKAVLDLYILRTQPKFLGPEVPVNIS